MPGRPRGRQTSLHQCKSRTELFFFKPRPSGPAPHRRCCLKSVTGTGKTEYLSVEESERLLKPAEDEVRRLRAQIENGAVELCAASKATPEIGAVELAGEHKGEIYGGILPSDNKPIWFSAAPRVMDHYNAAAWAEGQGGSLPTRKQGDYLTTLKGKGGAFTEIFNRGKSFPAGYVWLAEPYANYRVTAWCQRLSDGVQDNCTRNNELPVLSVRR